jgi:hypothetical protein
MHMGNFEDAEGLLLESLNKVSSGDLSSFAQKGASFAEHSTPSEHTPMSCTHASETESSICSSLCLNGTAETVQDAKDAETLANLTVCSLNLGKPATRYLK